MRNISSTFAAMPLKSFFNVFVVLIGIVVLFNGCADEEEVSYYHLEMDELIRCNADQINDSIQDQDCSLFNNGKLHAPGEGRNGSTALMLTRNDQYGFGFRTRVEKGEYYLASVWCRSKKGKGLIVSSSLKPGLHWRRSNYEEEMVKWPVERDGDWKKIYIEYFASDEMDGEVMGFFVWNSSEDTIYFDDFELLRTEKRYPKYTGVEVFRLDLDKSSMKGLKKVRKRAFEKGVLESRDEDWVKGIAFWEEDMHKVKLRLKGDWLDHLIGEKWSFRIKTKSDFAWKRMRNFSLHAPGTRSFLSEWFAHKVFSAENLISPRYGFIPLELNQKSLGIYAYEEHFDKHIVESHARREGPVLKFTEEAFWSIMRFKNEDTSYTMPFYQASVISPFKSSRTLGSPSLKGQFILGQNLLHQWRFNLKPASEVFDIEKMARFIAITDVLRARHGMTWHNKRFYYNPVTSRIEPIAYDCFSGDLNATYFTGKDMMPEHFRTVNTYHDVDEGFFNLCTDPKFLSSYLWYVEYYSDSSRIQSFVDRFHSDLINNEKLIQKEFVSYQYEINSTFERAKRIREHLPDLKQYFDSIGSYNKEKYNIEVKEYSKDPRTDFLKDYFIVYTENETQDSVILQYDNFFTSSFQVMGAGEREEFIDDWFLDKPVQIEAYDHGNEVNGFMKFSANAKFIFCLINDTSLPVAVPIIPWPKPIDYNPRQEISKRFNVLDNDLFKVNGKVIEASSDKFVLDNPIYIPAGFTLTLNEGSELDLVKGAYILSEGNIQFGGSEMAPIRITSSDGTAMGLTVLQAKDSNILEHVHFSNLRALEIDGWAQTGSVNFYETPVRLESCEFRDNQSEDALNIIRSFFIMNKPHFVNTFGDAFDSDFSRGTITNGLFESSGNDAVDLSGSLVRVTNTKMDHVGDKGFSAGEASTLEVEDCSVSNAEIAFASKDLSSLKVRNSKVNNATFGLVLLQKKPEFGPATAQLDSTSMEKVATKYLIETASVLMLDGKEKVGKKDDLGEQFYQ